jgi:hypothetical protein
MEYQILTIPFIYWRVWLEVGAPRDIDLENGVCPQTDRETREIEGDIEAEVHPLIAISNLEI